MFVLFKHYLLKEEVNIKKNGFGIIGFHQNQIKNQQKLLNKKYLHLVKVWF
jgi:hypothetical protein